MPLLRAGDPRLTAAIVATALFMQNLDAAAVATALPAMARDFARPAEQLGAAVTAYLVALTVCIPASGWIADRFGAKRVFLAAILVFASASIACGAAQSFGELVAARIVQGIGGAMMVPVGRLLLLRGVPKSQLISATTWLTMPGLLGPVVGPPLGGILTDTLSWRWVFWINIPVGVLGLLLAWKLIPEPPRDPPPPLDGRGLVLAGAALAALMFGLENAGRTLVPAWLWAASLGLGATLGWLAIRHAQRAAAPALDLTLLAVPSFRVAAAAGTWFRIASGVTPFLLALTLQTGFGWTATQSGLVALATAVGAFAMKPLARPVLRAFGFRDTLLANTLLAAIGIALPAAFAPTTPLWLIFLALAAGGLARSLQFTAYNTLAFAELPPRQMSAGTALYGVAQQLPSALGVVLAGASLAVTTALAGRSAAGLPDFAIGFLVAGVVTLLALPATWRLPRGAAREVSGHRG
jgi:EmrB/QacA subfamily drug resistance transporter